MLKNFLLVFIGGGLGSVLRYWIGTRLNGLGSFPWGTWVANIFGSLIIGFVLAKFLKYEGNMGMVLLLAVGFCGGFTTFSAFAFENFELIKAGNYLTALGYIIASLMIALAMVVVGFWLARQV